MMACVFFGYGNGCDGMLVDVCSESDAEEDYVAVIGMSTIL